jgi:L-lactate dehydrogenase complex protein LldG
MTKEAILGAIRRGLRRGELPGDQQTMLRDRMAHPPRQLIPGRSQVPRPEQVALLIRNIEKDFGTLERVPDGDAVPEAVAGYLAQNNLPSMLAMGPHPELQTMPWSSRPLLLIREGRALPTDMVSVQQAFAAVAETGTLMLPSDPERPTTLNLLSDTAIVVLRTSRVVGPYEDAWDLLRRERQDAVTGGFMPRNVMLVTGPSRSADIEQTLELGAHGPRRLHVVLIEDDPAARAA